MKLLSTAMYFYFHNRLAWNDLANMYFYFQNRLAWNDFATMYFYFQKQSSLKRQPNYVTGTDDGSEVIGSDWWNFPAALDRRSLLQRDAIYCYLYLATNVRTGQDQVQ